MEILQSILTSVQGFDQLDEATKQRVHYNASLIVVADVANTANQAVQKALKKEVIDNLDGLDLNTLSKLVSQIKNKTNEN